MRRYHVLFIVLVFILAACGGNAPAPTADTSTVATPETATSAPEQAATPLDQSALATAMSLPERIYETGQPTMPPPGQLINAASTPDPQAGLIFDSIQYQQIGDGVTTDVELLSNGTVTRNGAASTITADQVVLIDNLLDQINFFGIQGVFAAPGAGEDVFRYKVTVNRAGASMTIDAQDGFVPPELRELFSLLNSLGAPTQPSS